MRKLIFILLLCLTTSASAQFFAPHQKPMLGLQINNGHQLGDGVAYWLFNEGSGNKVLDLSGNKYDGIINFDINWQAGKFGSALNIQGNNDYIGIGVPSAVPLLASNHSTIVSWINLNASPSTYNMIYGNYWNQGLWLAVDSDSKITVSHTTSGGTDLWTGQGTAMSTGEWHQVCGTWNGTTKKAYQDGLEVGTTNPGETGSLDWSTLQINIGMQTNWSYVFNGVIDHIIVFNRALSPSEIAKLYREPFCMVGPSFNWCLYNAITVTAGGQVIFIMN